MLQWLKQQLNMVNLVMELENPTLLEAIRSNWETNQNGVVDSSLASTN
jgi:hypothetical protein